MIRVDVEPYCDKCLDFEPDVTKPERCKLKGAEFVFSDTIIQCKHRKRCAGLVRFLERQTKGEVTE